MPVPDKVMVEFLKELKVRLDKSDNKINYLEKEVEKLKKQLDKEKKT